MEKIRKKAWRAADVEDIKEFLEDEERQVIGGGVVSEKTDDTLFVLDTVPKKQQVTDGKKQTKASRKNKALKCLSMLLPDPNSKVVRTPDTETFQKGKRRQLITDLKEQKSGSKLRVVAKEQRSKVDGIRDVRRAKKRKLPVVDEDIWAEPSDGKTHMTVRPPKRFRKKPSALPATVLPHPGASVNPAYEDHQALLNEARIVEVVKYKEEKKIFNALDGKFPTKRDAPTEADYLVEMAAGLVPSSDEEDESDDGDGDIVPINPPVRREDRKTRKQRRVELEVDIQKKDKKSYSAAKHRENMVLRIPTMKIEINKEEKTFKERAVKKAVVTSQLKFKTKHLGNIKFSEQELALKLSDELVGSLREIKPEGHVIQDVYKSLQRRNIVEPRIRQKNKRTYKPKVYEKKSHREVTL